MPDLQLKIVNNEGEEKEARQGKDYLNLCYFEEYQIGDIITVETEKCPIYLMVQLDEALPPSLIYLTTPIWKYYVPIEEKAKKAYSPKAFYGNTHNLSVRKATEEEIKGYRNVALNPHDQNKIEGAYPHAVANVETRNDSTFFARNVIDGMIANEDHGNYPYQSWGINRQANAEITIEFGRIVEADKVQIVLRGDYPHDSYWTHATLEFSDGSEMGLEFEKVLEPQAFSFDTKQVEWVKLKNLIKAEDESPFPALTEFEVYGRSLE